MKLCFSPDVYIRCVSEDFLLWHKRNSVCIIYKEAGVFLNELSWEWQEVDDIVKKISTQCNVPAKEVNKDFWIFCQPLIQNGFLICNRIWEVEGISPQEYDTTLNSPVLDSTENHDDFWTPLGSFFEKHHIPAELHIDLTSACTERCVHCYIPEYTNRYLDFELVKKALDEYRVMGGLTVHLSGGECMLHPQFDDIVRYCQAQNINMIILSNMTLCDDKKIAVLKEVDPQFINVSLYSMNPEQHDAVTMLKGSWQRTMDAILKCEAEGIHIRLAAPVLKENRENYGAIVDFANEHYMHLIPDVDIFPQCNQNDSNMEHALSPIELEAFMSENRSLFAESFKHRMPCAEDKVCDIGVAHICLDSQGHYYPCDGTHGIILGDVRTDTLANVWNGEKFNALRKLKNKDFPTCVSCENRPYCKVCPAHNFNATGDILRHSPQKCAFAAVKRKLFGK